MLPEFFFFSFFAVLHTGSLCNSVKKHPAGEAPENPENSTLQGARIQVKMVMQIKFSFNGIVGQGLDQNSFQNVFFFFFFF